MQHTTDDNATTWRDLADQLTTDQVTFLEQFEATALSDPASVAEHLLAEARDRARHNLEDAARFGHLAMPAGAVKMWHWEDDGEGRWSRMFDGTRRGFGLDRTGVAANRVDVFIDGVQYADGSIVRKINVYSDSGELTADEARALATAFVEAADELERLQ